ncbi:MAG: pantoate--beta-alanine ligase [Ignavibacteriaceae bacterium]
MSTVKGIQKKIDQLKKKGKTIGLVPTMGYLHDGHISLVRRSKKRADVTVVSVFVNPTQFTPNEDYNKYPRDIKRDRKVLRREQTDILFCPDVSDIYRTNFQTYTNVENITKILEGETRPNHFKGVTTIVSILFNCVKPDITFFGQKDAQQAEIIKRMVNDLKFDIKVEVCPIIREKDGLALSSRNVYLSDKERKDALILNKSLRLGENMIKNGETSTKKILSEMKKLINSVDSSNLDYVSIVEKKSFSIAKSIEKGERYYILIACKIGTTRLIDNLLVKV